MRIDGRPDLVGEIAGGSVVATFGAAAQLRRRHPTRRELDGLVRLTRRGDALARTTAAYGLGRAAGALPARTLLALLDDADHGVREAAALSFLDRPAPRAAGARLRAEQAAGGFTGMLASMALYDGLSGEARRARAAATRVSGRRSRGLRIVQVFLPGKLDAGLFRAGEGDGGGLATLLVHVSRELGRRPGIDRVTTITRAFDDDEPGAPSARARELLEPGASIERISFGPTGYMAARDMWAHAPEVEQALTQAFRELHPVDVVHLRFADVGTFAAARVARRLGIPIVFTLAPDPHAVLREAERAGTLTRESFPAANVAERYLLRAWLVESLLEQAGRLVLFPRQDAERDLGELLGVGARSLRSGRFRTVAEGVSLDTVDRARIAAVSRPEPHTLRDLRAAIRSLPPERTGLPLILSVGRLHRVKGFPRLVEAWAGDPELRRAFNLVIVGGRLDRPTDEEAGVLEAIAATTERIPGAEDGLVLLGGRSHAEVAELLHATRAGLSGDVGAAGVYACASVKEEFGLAILEALLAGLPVVAPAHGGPPTYIEDGSTGALADTSTPLGLAEGLRRAASLRSDDARALSAATMVRERFSLEAMAVQLEVLYSELADDRGIAVAA